MIKKETMIPVVITISAIIKKLFIGKSCLEQSIKVMVIIFVALGASIGAWGSIISMRRFLDA